MGLKKSDGFRKRHSMGVKLYISGPFYQHSLTLIPTWIGNHMPGKMSDEITYPFLNFNGATVEV